MEGKEWRDDVGREVSGQGNLLVIATRYPAVSRGNELESWFFKMIYSPATSKESQSKRSQALTSKVKDPH